MSYNNQAYQDQIFTNAVGNARQSTDRALLALRKASTASDRNANRYARAAAGLFRDAAHHASYASLTYWPATKPKGDNHD